MNLRGAGIEEVHQDALTLAYAQGLPRAQYFVVDGVKRRADFEPVRSRIGSSGFFGRRAVGIRWILVRVHGAQEILPLPQGQKDFLVVAARVMRGIDHEETELAGIRAPMQIEHSLGMRVVPP